jgi:hypothetical protein
MLLLVQVYLIKWMEKDTFIKPKSKQKNRKEKKIARSPTFF